jgi:hypothetical protein
MEGWMDGRKDRSAGVSGIGGFFPISHEAHHELPRVIHYALLPRNAATTTIVGQLGQKRGSTTQSPM